MNYPDSVSFLYALGNELKTAKLGLERIARLMAEFGNPQLRPARYIHVAGTNGKGSTCAMIESGLRASGLRTGLFTSPHLLEPTERIRIDGQPVSPAEFTRAFDEVHATAERLLTAGEIDLHPTYFETVTAMSFLLFRARQVDISVLEVGLGGRLDSTKIVEPELCVITPIDFDHEKFLGSSIESIAAEKAGILKRGVPAITAPQRPEARAVIGPRATEVQAPAAVEVHREGSRIEWGPYHLECPLRGRHQVINTVTAAAALEALLVPQAAIEAGIRNTRWPGRLEAIHHNPEILVDGAHNPAGARALAEYVAEFYNNPQPVLIFGAMRDKAVEEMTGTLFPHFRQVIVTAPDQSRALAPETIKALADHPNLITAPNLQAALHQAMELDIKVPGSAVFVSGSLFLVAEAMRLLRE